MTSVQELQTEYDRRGLIRKVKSAVAFLGNKDEVDLPETLTDANGALEELGEGWLPVGIVTPDGYTFGRDVDQSEVDALGYGSPVRTDVESIERTVTFTALEYGRRHMLELRYGTDLSGVEQDENGEIVFDELDLPEDAEYRLLIIGSDGPPDNRWILGRGFPNVKLSDAGEDQWSKEDPVQSEYTLQVSSDEDEGTPARHYIGGTAALKHADDLGFDQA